APVGRIRAAVAIRLFSHGARTSTVPSATTAIMLHKSPRGIARRSILADKKMEMPRRRVRRRFSFALGARLRVARARRPPAISDQASRAEGKDRPGGVA